MLAYGRINEKFQAERIRVNKGTRIYGKAEINPI